MDDLAQTEGQVGDEVGGRQDLEHRQLRDGRQRMGVKIERTGTDPGTLQLDVFEAVFDQLADPRGAIDVWNDLEQEVRGFERGLARQPTSAGACL